MIKLKNKEDKKMDEEHIGGKTYEIGRYLDELDGKTREAYNNTTPKTDPNSPRAKELMTNFKRLAETIYKRKNPLDGRLVGNIRPDTKQVIERNMNSNSIRRFSMNYIFNGRPFLFYDNKVKPTAR